jgi:Transposase DDE domain
MPDTPELQAAFGRPDQQAVGCGFPVAHLLTLFHAGTGLLLRTIAAPLRTNDMVQAAQLHGEMAAGDVLVADRGFCSYAHLALLASAGLHAVFRLHQKQLVSFRIGRLHSPPQGRYKNVKGLPRTRWVKWLGTCDQIVECPKPKEVPDWLAADVYASLPATLTLRELRWRIEQPGCRTHEVILVTTLLDAELYPTAEVATLYGQRWQVETNLRHLKQTLGMDVLRTKTVVGIHKELAVFALVYNLVRLVMLKAAARQQVPIERISFIAALRWLCHACYGATLGKLEIVPRRPGRNEPRVRKRRPKKYNLMTKPRHQPREASTSKELTH